MDCCGSVASLGFLRVLVTLALQAAPVDAWQAEASETQELDSGFHLLYKLKPEQARAQFAIWQDAHPEDPMGRASEAASHLTPTPEVEKLFMASFNAIPEPVAVVGVP